MKFLPVLLLVLLLFSCTVESATETMPTEKPPAPQSSLPDLGEAPELTNDVWLNTPEPLRLANLRGQVVLLEMWTFG